LPDYLYLDINFPSIGDVIVADVAGGAGVDVSDYQVDMRVADGGLGTNNGGPNAAQFSWLRPASLATAPFPNVYLRVHGITVTKVERAALVAQVYNSGIQYKCTDMELQLRHPAPLASAGSAAQFGQLITHEIPLVSLKQPSVITTAISRFHMDSQIATGGTIAVASGQNLAAQIAAAGANFFNTVNWAPQRFASIPVSRFTVNDNGMRVFPVFTTKFNHHEMKKHGLRYNAILQPGLAVIPHSRWSNIESQGLGHFTYR
jgi:hypothetical protein